MTKRKLAAKTIIEMRKFHLWSALIMWLTSFFWEHYGFHLMERVSMAAMGYLFAWFLIGIMLAGPKESE